MTTIVGQVPAYAGGQASVGQATAPIDQQGNFAVPVSPSPAVQTIKLTPPQGSPYSTLSLSVTLTVGATNITAQAAAAFTTVGKFIGLLGCAPVNTEERGYASRGGSSQPFSSLVVNNIGSSAIILNDESGNGVELLSTGAISASANAAVDISAGSFIFLNSGADGFIISASLIYPQLIYSAAGTPLPAARSGLAGARAVVSDATAPTWMGTYASGGTVTCPVFCNGTTWLTA
jgi:hypothetical protein